jgi:C4-dicarboxylate transporter/malic acid transport protein
MNPLLAHRAQHHHPGRRHRFLADLERPADLFAQLGPNWFASVMGTGIVANAAASLPWQSGPLRAAAIGVWALATLMLACLLVAWLVHFLRHPTTARGHAEGHARNPVMAQFWGAPPMALMTVGAGAVLLGRDWIGLGTAIRLDWVLWTAGTLAGLITAAWIPYKMMTSHDIRDDSAFGGWLMPVVPPMVSSANGALLIPHLPPGQARLGLLLACYAMFGLSLFATMFIVPQVWQRLVRYKLGVAAGVPTVWIVLGPLGQSITAANQLASDATGVLRAPYGQAAEALGLFYGVPTWGFATLWLALAAALTLRTARRTLPFSLTWWSFIFPVGTLVTGTSALSHRIGADLFTVAAVALYVLLVTAWITVATRTARGSYKGHLFRPAGPPQTRPPSVTESLAA